LARVDDLDTSVASGRRFHHRRRDHGVLLDMEVSHGSAIGIGVSDPGGNRNAVTRGTGLRATKIDRARVDRARVDLEASPAGILRSGHDKADRRSATGDVEPGSRERVEVGH
jgi:hypothetical protein